MVLGTYFPLDIDSLTQLPQIERARHLEKHGVCEEQHGVGNFGGEDATGWAGVITAGQPPMTRATVARTGGFGGSMTTAGG